MPHSLWIGLDAGGTKTALLAEGGGRRWTTTGPGVNLRRDGLAQTVRVLSALIRDAQATFFEAELAGLCAGVAGAGVEGGAVTMALRKRLELDPPVPVLVTHDAEIALEAAFGAESGVVLIAGTGSVVYGRTIEPRTLRAGGWGYRLGDDGSGTALGRAALRAVARALDGGPSTRLSHYLADAHGLDSIDTLLAWTYDEDGTFASLATVVLEAAEAGDRVAADLLHDETDALAQQATWLARQAGGRLDRRVALLGGLTSEALYREALIGALAHRLPGWFVARCEHEPVEGALARAKRLTPMPS
ncbi:MAG: hypothetical protein HKN04_09315 [Rhodothermaceae bacterium]|nr:hypothetical protein [Rhodothermaceae bacterium]